MKNSCISLLCFLAFSCKKEDKYEAENAAITGDMTYQQTGFIVLTATPDSIPLTAQISIIGNGTLNIIGDITMTSSFVYDFVEGKGSDLTATYADAEGTPSPWVEPRKPRPGKNSSIISPTMLYRARGALQRSRPPAAAFRGPPSTQTALGLGESSG